MAKNKRITAKSKGKVASFKPLRYVCLLLVIFSIYEIILHFVEPRLLPIRHIKMDSHQFERIDLGSLRERVLPRVKGFFSTDVRSLKKEALKEPFVNEVIVQRLWPDCLMIKLTELEIVARWGKNACVSSKGDIIPIKESLQKSLPLFEGPTEQVANLLAVYNELSVLLRPYNMAVAKLELNMRHSWQLTLDSGMEIILGRKEIIERMKSFLTVYPALKKKHENAIDTIDLRHTNGFSIKPIMPAKGGR